MKRKINLNRKKSDILGSEESMNEITPDNQAKKDISDQIAKENHELRENKRLKYDEMIEKADLNYRYFRNNNLFKQKQTNINHNGVICIGYKIIKENQDGIKFSLCVAFCSPKDSFSRRKAKEQLVERYFNGDNVTFHIDYGSSKEIETLIKSLWNGRKIPVERLGIRPILPGKEIILKPWMRYIR